MDNQRICNQSCTYKEMTMWKDERWNGCENEAAPLFRYLNELLRDKSLPEHFAGRTDEIRDTVNHAAYFPDYLESWEQRGMHFSSYGMMGEMMTPAAVEKQEIPDPKVLYIPVVRSEDPHAAMNLLAENEEVLEAAAKEQVVVQLTDCLMSTGGGLIEKLIETQGTYRIGLNHIYLDISVLDERGLSLSDVPGLTLSEWRKPEQLCGRMVVEITGKLTARVPHQYSIGKLYRKFIPEWDYERHIRTPAGKRQAESMQLEALYTGPHDPAMQSFFEERGVRYEDHCREREWYVTLTPESCYTEPERKIPLLIVMKEPRTACEFSMQTAFQFYYDFIEICARGEFMMLYFAMETPEDNSKLLPPVIAEVMEQYPVDEQRIYLTGQSHNGYYAQEFYREHPHLIAACAALCDPVGLELGARADYYLRRGPELIQAFREYDFPLIVINGNLENNYPKKNRSPEKREEDISCFINRMKSLHLREYTADEIEAARESSDYATRMNGVPADRTSVRFLMGCEIYVSDYQNEDGKWHYRYASIENTPHMIMPQMAELSWEFLKRFSRNPKTGECMELY